MSHLLTDVTPILTRAFPGGKPEMSASDFDKAKKFVEDRRLNKITAPTTMDYAFWAQTMIVEWRLTVADWEKGGKVGPEPAFLLCPICNVMLLLDTMQGDVLLCPGGCHRAITLNSFVALFRAPAKTFRQQYPTTSAQAQAQAQLNLTGGFNSKRIASTAPAPARLDSRVPQGASPEDYGIHEEVKKSRTPLVGWRMWRLMVPGDGSIRIRSLHSAKATSWEPMQPQRGTCDNLDPSEITDHSCPSWEHRCGVHAVKEVAQLRKWGIKIGLDRVAGEVEMWGRVLEYEEGYRAEWAYPIRLWLPQGTDQYTADALWEAYLTEVNIDDGTIFKQIDSTW